MYKKILLPTDGSKYADDEAERATRLLADGGEIIVLSVAGKLTSTAFQFRSNVRKINKELYEEAEKNVEHMLSLFDDSLNVTGRVEEGFVFPKYLSGLHRFILGSVTEQVLKTSEIDVLLVPNK